MFICVYKCTYVCMWVGIHADVGQMRTDGVLNHSTYSFEAGSLHELGPHDSSVRLEARKPPGISVFLSSLWVWVSDALGVGSSYVDAGRLSLAFIIVQQVCLTAEPSLKPYDLFPLNTESRKIETAYIVLAVLVLHSAGQVQSNCTALCWSVGKLLGKREWGNPYVKLKTLLFFLFAWLILCLFVLRWGL